MALVGISDESKLNKLGESLAEDSIEFSMTRDSIWPADHELAIDKFRLFWETMIKVEFLFG